MSGFVGFALSVKEWTTRPPSVEGARPLRCPRCGCPKQADGRAMIVGHGLRGRWVVDLAAEVVDLLLRRYRCRRCGAVITVGPAELAPRRQYTRAAIALGLALWSLVGLAGHRVRSHLSPQRRIGDGTLGRWPVLRRWARGAAALFAVADVDLGRPREIAAVVCHSLAARAPPDAREFALVDRVVSGAAGRRIEATRTMLIAAV